MMKICQILLMVSLFGMVGCLPDGSRQASTDQDLVVAYEYVREVWVQNHVGLSKDELGNAHNSKCNISNLHINDSMSLNQFNHFVGAHGRDIDAEWSALRPNASIIVYNPNLDPYERRYDNYHELMHFFSWCTGEHRDADENHSDERLWGYHGIEGQAIRSCYADHTNITIDEFESMTEMDIGVCPFRPNVN